MSALFYTTNNGLGVVVLGSGGITLHELRAHFMDEFLIASVHVWPLTKGEFFLEGDAAFRHKIVEDGGLRVGKHWLPFGRPSVCHISMLAKMLEPDQGAGGPSIELFGNSSREICDKYLAARKKVENDLLAYAQDKVCLRRLMQENEVSKLVLDSFADVLGARPRCADGSSSSRGSSGF